MRKLGNLQSKSILSLVDSGIEPFQNWLEKGLYAYYIENDHNEPFISESSPVTEKLLNQYICDTTFELGAVEGLKYVFNQLKPASQHRESFKSAVVGLLMKTIDEPAFNGKDKFLAHIINLGEMINATEILTIIYRNRSRVIESPKVLDAALDFMIGSYRSTKETELKEFICAEMNDITLNERVS